MRTYFIFLVKAVVVLLPWRLRRHVLTKAFGYDLHPQSRIGWCSWVFPKRLTLRRGAAIGPLNVVIHVDLFEMGEYSTLGRGNWITGHPLGSIHFRHRPNRDPSLFLGEHSSVTKSHLIDCTDQIRIGAFTTVAGYSSQFLTHGIDVGLSRQDCRPIEIGDFCLIGTRVTILPGSGIPDRCVLAAGSVLTKKLSTSHTLYAGVPARPIKRLPQESPYFSRSAGFVD